MQPDESNGDYPLGPPETPDTDRPMPSLPQVPSNSFEPQTPEPFQFSLAELLLLTTGAAFFLSLISTLLHWLPKEHRSQNFAGLMGVGALVTLIIVALIPRPRRIVLVGFWVFIGLYLTACLVTLIRG